MKFVLLNFVKIFSSFSDTGQLSYSFLGLVWVFSRNIIISFEIVLMKVILYECYCEIMTGLVEIYI